MKLIEPLDISKFAIDAVAHAAMVRSILRLDREIAAACATSGVKLFVPGAPSTTAAFTKMAAYKSIQDRIEFADRSFSIHNFRVSLTLP